MATLLLLVDPSGRAVMRVALADTSAFTAATGDDERVFTNIG